MFAKLIIVNKSTILMMKIFFLVGLLVGKLHIYLRSAAKV